MYLISIRVHLILSTVPVCMCLSAVITCLLLFQTILPLINCFGKGICTDGIDALVRIGILDLLGRCYDLFLNEDTIEPL